MKMNKLHAGVYLLWDNTDSLRDIFGPWSVVKVLKRTSKNGFILKFPDNTIPQFIDHRSIKRNCTIITKDLNPEYFL